MVKTVHEEVVYMQQKSEHILELLGNGSRRHLRSSVPSPGDH